MGELILPFGLLERLLPVSTFDPDRFARRLAPMLDRGDRKAAETAWMDFSERAMRVLTRKKVTPEVQLALIRELSAAVRLALYATRGSTRLGPVPPRDRQRPEPARSSATILPFRRTA